MSTDSAASSTVSSGRRPPWLTLIAVFVATRLALHALGVVGAVTFPDRQTMQTQSLEALNPRQIWHRFDSLWYERIATVGYANDPEDVKSRSSAAYLPLYPMIAGGAMRLVGGADFFWTASALSNIFSIAALLLVMTLAGARRVSSDEFLKLYFSGAGTLYLSIPYTESLYILLVAGVLILMGSRRYEAAAVLCGLACVTRIQGVALAPALALALVMREGLNARTLTRLAAIGVICAAPVAGYAWYSNQLFGDPLAFLNAQASWSNPHPYPLQALLGLIQYPRIMSAWLHGALWCVYALLLVRLWRKIALPEAVFCAGVLLISSTTEIFYGAYRYVLPLFPLYFALVDDERWVRATFICASLILGTLWVIAFVTSNRIAV